MANTFLLNFFRFTIGLVFAISLVGKLRDVPSFFQTITNFRFFPSTFSKPLAYLFLLGECGTIIAMVIGGPFLFWGFLAAAAMFLSFSIALLLVVKRKIETSCNCFGPDEKNVDIGHIVRSAGFMLCAISGLVLRRINTTVMPALNWIEWLLIGMASTTFVLVWMRISEIVKIFVFKNEKEMT